MDDNINVRMMADCRQEYDKTGQTSVSSHALCSVVMNFGTVLACVILRN